MVEYRVLSSGMMSSTPKLNFVWNQVMKALKACQVGFNIPGKVEVQDAINNSNVELAERLIEDYNLA